MWLTADRNPEPFGPTEAVLVFELAADEELKSGVLAPADCVGVVADVGSQVAAVSLVAPVAGRTDLLVGLFDCLEERPPGNVVDAGDLLGRRRPQHVDVLLVVTVTVSDALAGEELLPAGVRQLIPEAR